MPLVTAISAQKKKKGRFNVYIDGQFAFGISQFTLLENSLKIGKILSEEQILKILKKEDLTKYTDAAVKFLSFRPRSEKEIKDYLAKKIATVGQIPFHEAQDSAIIELVLKKLRKYNYIDDYEFAKWFIESRTKVHPKGIKVLKLELKQKGIDLDIIEKILKKDRDETTLALKAIEKKVYKWQKLPEMEFKRKIYQFLASRGFEADTITEIFAFLLKKR